MGGGKSGKDRKAREGRDKEKDRSGSGSGDGKDGLKDLKTSLAFLGTVAAAAYVAHKAWPVVFGEGEKLKEGVEDAVLGRDRGRKRDSWDKDREKKGRSKSKSKGRSKSRGGADVVIEERFRNGRQEGRRIYNDGKLVLDEDNSNGGNGNSNRGRGGFVLDRRRRDSVHQQEQLQLRPRKYYELDGCDDVEYVHDYNEDRGRDRDVFLREERVLKKGRSYG